MDETQTRWFRWIADHASHYFWGIWGAGFGAAAAILLGATSVTGDILRIYLAILTALMGGVFGLVSARAMDQRSDRRALERKAYVARLHIRSLLQEVRGARRYIMSISEKADLATPDRDLVSQVIVYEARVYRAAETAPDFDAFISSEDDLKHAELVAWWFRWSRLRWTDEHLHSANITKRDSQFRAALSKDGQSIMDGMVRDLSAADKHFARFGKR